MSTASGVEDVLEPARPWLAALIKDSEYRTGSRMTAYEDVASKTGLSASWVRKAITRQAASHNSLTLKVPSFRRIAAAYVRLCEAIEAKEEQERLKRGALLERAYAALKGIDSVVADVPVSQEYRSRVEALRLLIDKIGEEPEDD